MRVPRLPVREAVDDVDALVEQWTGDATAARNRTLNLVRTTHLAMGPLVVLSCLLFLPGSALAVASIIYLIGLVIVLGVVHRTSQVGWLGAFDIVLLGFVSSTDPILWVTLLVPALAATSSGWLVSR